MIVDTHAHYDDSAFDEDRDDLLSSMRANGIGTIIDVCASVKSLTEVPELISSYPFLYGAAGIHPDDAPDVDESVLERVRSLCRQEKFVAVGEIGLDYYWHKEREERSWQQMVFRAQLDIAREENKPVIIHSRDAALDTLDILQEYFPDQMAGGVMHCFSYSWEVANVFLEMGMYLGIGGVVTYKNGKKLKEVVDKAPLEQLLLETDCPYLSPTPYRGMRNSSLNLPLVVKEIADRKRISEEEVIRVTQENAKRLFRLEK